MKIEINPEIQDQIIVKDLVWNIYNIAKAGKDEYETPANKIHKLSALLVTLEYYTTKSEFDELTKNLSVKLKPSKKGQL
jgi:hypothetical protein